MQTQTSPIKTGEATPKTRWWHQEDGKVVCTLCPRECHIPCGSRGFCFVRANVDGQLELTSYGRSSGFCVDPIEKKPLNHFLPGTPVLSFGTAGCNLGCKFCQNWDISKSREMDSVANQATPEAIIRAAKQAGCRSVAFTYNDPIIWAEYAIDVAKVAREQGVKTVAVTAGYISPDARGEFFDAIDAANVDLKAFTDSFYRRLTQTHLQPVLDTLKYLKHETDVWFEITNLVIPTENDDPGEIQQMCDWIVDNLGDDVPIHFSAFHPDFKMRDYQPTPHETLIRARELALQAGIKFAYVGNVNDQKNQSTYCPNCGKVLIERDWYQLGAYNLDGHCCRACGHAIPGVFDSEPGTWGRKRLPLRILEQPPTGNHNMTTTSQSTPKQIETATDDKPTGDAPKIDFSEEQAAAILAYVRDAARAAVAGSQPTVSLSTDVSNAPAYGLFVTFCRQKALRACRGRWGGTSMNNSETPFGQLLEQVTRDSAVADPRFPAITADELGLLNLDISIMHSPGFLDAEGAAQADQVEVGTHGLVLIHPDSQGLLLPQVATEAGWDAVTFLDQVCRKAGLPKETWRNDPRAKIMTFKANVLTQDAPEAELHAPDLTRDTQQHLANCANRLLQGEAIDAAEYAALATTYPQELGLHLHTNDGITAAAVGPNNSLLNLARITANSLKDLYAKRNAKPGWIDRVTLMYHPIRLSPNDYPDRHRYLAANAVVARAQGRWTIALPDLKTRRDPIGQALNNLKISPATWRGEQDPNSLLRATAFSVLSFTAQAPTKPQVTVRRPRQAKSTRPAAQAGRFYPKDPEEMAREIEQHIATANGTSASTNRKFRAVMLPHAGWAYCGDTMGKTLARVDLPKTAIILGPKHTFDGPPLSITPDTAWAIPGGSVPIATDLVDTLADAIDNLQVEPDAHRTEHGSEVLLPFLQRLRPDIRVAPIVVGAIGYAGAIELGQLLADTIAQLEQPPLLIISSDLNHFATETENRRLDHLALDAMKTADPQTLFETCRDNDISMCGLLPAVAVMHALKSQAPLDNIQIVDYTNSATVTADPNRVVGYGGALLP